ncbi:MAG: hypothetical protein IJ092_06315 [Atopobiaceae bacterium]|nr:hypothetical protein [Atopobiaceae bacterium]
MGPLRNYRLPDGTTRQYRDGEQPEGAVVVETAAKQTPESRAAKAPARRRAAKKEG